MLGIEALDKVVKRSQICFDLGTSPTGNKSPSSVDGSFGIVEPSCVFGRIDVQRLGSGQKFVSCISHPRKDQKALPSAALSLKFASLDSWSRFIELYSPIGWNLMRIICLVATPYRKQNSPLSLGVHLNTKVSFSETVGHEV